MKDWAVMTAVTLFNYQGEHARQAETEAHEARLQIAFSSLATTAFGLGVTLAFLAG